MRPDVTADGIVHVDALLASRLCRSELIVVAPVDAVDLGLCILALPFRNLVSCLWCLKCVEEALGRRGIGVNACAIDR